MGFLNPSSAIQWILTPLSFGVPPPFTEGECVQSDVFSRKAKKVGRSGSNGEPGSLDSGSA